MTRFISFAFKSLLRKLHNAEHADFYASGIIKHLIAIMPSLPTASGIFATLRTTYQKEDELFKQSQAAPQTKDMVALHEKRISLFTFFWNSVNMAKFFDNAAKAAAGESLQFLHNIYKDMSLANYTDANGLMTNFLEDCDKPQWKPFIETLELTQLIGMAKAANEAFIDLFRERSFDKAQAADMGTLYVARNNVDEVFDAFVEAVSAAWTANEFGPKDPAVRAALIEVRERISGAVSDAELVLARRGRHKIKSDDKTDDATQTPDTTNPAPPPGDNQNPDTMNPSVNPPTQQPGGGPHVLDPNEHPPAGE
ncbi:MAG: DUF6261 family protein [Tannerellaceae bacterium]|nr:DUF6261 family protein [Tannerellaceae bacterium]